MVLTGVLLIGLLLLLLFLNIPLVVAIGLPTLIITIVKGYGFVTFAQRAMGAVDSFPLLAIPFFMLAGKIMEEGGMSERIVRLANAFVGWLAGGLSHVLIIASAFFGALSGSGPATTAAIGSILIPEMKKRGFPADMVSGLSSVAGALGIIIPPSIPMIIYGVQTGTPIGQLFAAGVIPGIVLAGFLMLTASAESRRRGVRQTGVFTFGELWRSFVDSFWALLVPIIVLGGIYGGVFTPTEAGAVAAVYGFIAAGFIYKELSAERLLRILQGSVANTILVMAIIAVSGVFSWLLTVEGIARTAGTYIGAVATNRFTFLLLVNVIFLIVGCFIETVAGILILTPILFPIALKFGVDPVHFGIIIVVNLALGLATPPVGENQYIAAAISKIGFEKQVKAAIPFLVSALLALAVITYVPQLSLWLPTLLFR